MPWQDDPIVQPAKGGWQNDPIVGQQDSQPQRTHMQQIGRDAAFAGGKMVEGATALITLPVDALGGFMDWAESKVLGPTYEVTVNGQKVTKRRGENLNASEQVTADLERLGVPTQPENRTEEVLGTIYRGVGGAATGVGAGSALARSASPVAAGVGRTLAANPVLQAVSGATGGAGAEVAKEMGGGPIAQLIGGLAGAVAPSVGSAVAQSAVRGTIRGGEAGRQTMQSNLNTFERVGTSPSVGQATGGRVARAAESGLSRSPGGAGPMTARAEAQAEQVGARLEQRAQELAGRSASAEQTGRAIQTAVRGEGGFVENFKANQTRLYDVLDNFLPKDTQIGVSRTKAALAALNAEIPGAPETSKFFTNARIQAIENALKSDLRRDQVVAQAGGGFKELPGTLPYEAVKKLRTLVGNEIADAGLASDVPRSKWKALYAALSDDLGQATANNAPARAAWTRANNYARAGIRRLEAIDSVIDRAGGPEAIFKAATSGTKEGASTLRAVMQSVGDDERRLITATVVRRLGLAKAGVQGDLGDKFSAETFLTNWNLLSNEAKATLFNRYGSKFRQDMDAVARYASNLRTGAQVFRNPSGTSQATAQSVAVTTFVISLLSGNLKTAGAVAAAVGGANLSARLMTNPKFVKWLAQTTRLPQGAKGAAVNQLVRVAEESGDVDIARAAALIEQVQNGDDEQRN